MCTSFISFFFNMAEMCSEPSFHPYSAEENVLLVFLPPNDDDDDHSPRFVRVLVMKDPSCARH